MSFDDSFSNRVAMARNAIGLTQTELAKKVGVVPRQIAAYEGGEAKPRDKALKNLAAALGTTTEWLAQGSGKGPDVKNIKKTLTIRQIPIITHVNAGEIDLNKALDFSSAIDFIPAPAGAGEKSFAIQIQGDSMESAEGISFPSGSIVTFDPEIEARDGDFVLCAVDDFDTTFKQLAIDQGKARLKPLNKSYSVIMSHGHPITILAVAIHVQHFVLRNNHKTERHSWNPIAPWIDTGEPDFSYESQIDDRMEKVEKKLDLILTFISESKDILTNKKPT